MRSGYFAAGGSFVLTEPTRLSRLENPMPNCGIEYLAGEGLIVVIGEPAGHQLAGGLRRPGVSMRERGVGSTREQVHAEHRCHDVKEAVTRLPGPVGRRGWGFL
jgi:hypothetical protein